MAIKKPTIKKITLTKKPTKKKESSYGASDIQVLKGLDPVRKRPGMYIGSTGSDGLHHLIWEVVDNSLDEAMAGYCDHIDVVLLANNKVKVSDNGRGIPVETHKQTGKSALETVMTTLHAGGKFGSDAYQVSGGLHGVGISVVCALSKFSRAEVRRDGFVYAQEYAKGKVKTKLKKEKKCPKGHGTTIIFEPDEEIFKTVVFDKKRIINHLRQQAYLNPGVKITIRDERQKPFSSYSFYFEGGIKSYVKYLMGNNEPKNETTFYTKGEKEGMLVEVALQYSKEIESFEESFANNIYTGEGGSHLTGFRTALTRTINNYARKNSFLKEKDENLTSNDVREGLIATISLKIRDPQFEGQTKAKLGNPEAKTAVEGVFNTAFTEFLEKNPNDGRAIIESCLLSARARRAAKAARTTILRKGVLDGLSLPGKLADCASKDPEESELYLVEGDSAGGSCFSGKTRVALVDGRNITFKELVKEHKEGRQNFCYTIQHNGHIGIALILHPRMTKKNARVIKVILDTGDELICTPDHKFMLRSGKYKEAQNLLETDSLMPLYRKFSKNEKKKRGVLDGYEMLFDPKAKNWMYTHVVSDMFNFEHRVYNTTGGGQRHHVDFNKLNNNPTNIQRLSYEKHMNTHYAYIEKTLHRPDVIERAKKTKQTQEFRERMSKIMSTPEMKKMLSERAKKQWENKEYKEFMGKKFLEFYKNNEEYRKKNNQQLNQEQKKYWSSEDNKKAQAERVKQYFIDNPEHREMYSEKAKEQWQNEDLLKWRSEETKKQWTPEFRAKRKESYNRTYLNESLKLLREVFDEVGAIDSEQYDDLRRERSNKNALMFQTVCQRFFDNSELKLQQAVENYNHKIKKIVKMTKRVDVYDLEVENTHNFALASGVFVHNSKMARDRRFQAILPLRGKILNVERARLDRILTSDEIKNLIIAMGTAISQDFDIEKLRYHRIILMADSDVDGAHIRTLLLTLFYRYFKEIIEKGYLYIAQPPLYKIQLGKRMEYGYTDADKEEILADMRKGKSEVKGINIQRYKGLGEMNPDELWETTMNPENRILLKVTIDNGKEADHLFDTLMGKEVMPRKKFIQVHAKKVKNLDI